MAFPKFQTKEVLNKVLNSGEDALNVDLSDSVTVTVDSEFPAAATITDNFANPTTTSAMSMLMGYDGSTWDRVTIGGGAEAAALRVTIASDSTGVVTVDDGGGALTVDGTVTANLSATDNAVLDAIDTVLDTIKVDTEAIETAVEAVNQAAEGTISATTQRVTIATDDDGVAHLATIAGAVSTQMQVDVVAISAQSDGTYIGDIKFGEALPAGSAAIGKLAANSGVDIGDVDVTSVIPGVAATSLGKAIQSAQGGTDTGVAALVVRNDALADLSGADGDYAPLQVNKTGALNVTETTGHLGAIFEDGTDNITSKQVIACLLYTSPSPRD